LILLHRVLYSLSIKFFDSDNFHARFF
jgi:hypothetical protein